jgi:transposase
MLGDERSKKSAFVASDMWKAFLASSASAARSVLHVLERFHVAQLLSKAVDTVRRDAMRGLRAAGRQVVLTKNSMALLKRPKNLTRKERVRLRDLVTVNLRSVRTYLLEEQFQHFWTYTSGFLERWTTMAMRSRLPPFKKFAKTLRQHQRELLNWFLARGKFVAGATEGFNNKARTERPLSFGPSARIASESFMTAASWRSCASRTARARYCGRTERQYVRLTL